MKYYQNERQQFLAEAMIVGTGYGFTKEEVIAAVNLATGEPEELLLEMWGEMFPHA